MKVVTMRAKKRLNTGKTPPKKAVKKRDAWKASLAQKTSEITGVSTRHVRRVISGECENEQVMNVYMALAEGENELVKAVKELVPFE